MYSSSHLFFFGDLNFRINIPPEHALATAQSPVDISHVLDSEAVREELKDEDQLLVERDQKGSAFVGFREGEFWKFKCSYKYLLGEVDQYRCIYLVLLSSTKTNSKDSMKRTPAWTDRIMYATYSDNPDTPTSSNITNALYTSIPSYVTSDHVSSRYLLPTTADQTRTPAHRSPSSLSYYCHPPTSAPPQQRHPS